MKGKKEIAEDQAKEDLVSVEMTEEQKEEVVDYLAKKQEEQDQKKDRYQLFLNYQHNINGVKYGPGLATVPANLVGKLQHQELLVNKREARLLISRSKTVQVFGQGVYKPVKVS